MFTFLQRRNQPHPEMNAAGNIFPITTTAAAATAAALWPAATMDSATTAANQTTESHLKNGLIFTYFSETGLLSVKSKQASRLLLC